MGDNKFVPDSDTKIRQQYQNKQNNAQGQHFEREILAGCRMYMQQGVAVIDKTPEPFRVSKKDKNGVFTGRFGTPAQPDFQGTLKNGRSIIFEAKSTGKDRITRNVLTDTQMQILEQHHKLGAVCGVCVSIKDSFFFVPWRVWRDMKDIYKRQYLKPEDIKEYKVSFDGAVHFLDNMLYIELEKTVGLGKTETFINNILSSSKMVFKLEDWCK